MKYINPFFLWLLFLVGCATEPIPELQDPLIFSNKVDNTNQTFFNKNKYELKVDSVDLNSDCVNIARQGKSIAELRQSGIDAKNLSEYYTDSENVKIQKEIIVSYILYKDGNPEQTYADILLTCRSVGVGKLEKVLKNKTLK
jgi:hypothetical protein